MVDPGNARDNAAAESGRPLPQIDTSVPHPARAYDYLLGGKDNFPADRASAERVLAAAPEMRDTARSNRAFLVRAVRFLAEQGIRQFLDIGTGIPTSPNVHEVAQQPRPAHQRPPGGDRLPGTPTSTIRRRSCGAPHRPWTSPNRWRCC